MLTAVVASRESRRSRMVILEDSRSEERVIVRDLSADLIAQLRPTPGRLTYDVRFRSRMLAVHSIGHPDPDAEPFDGLEGVTIRFRELRDDEMVGRGRDVVEIPVPEDGEPPCRYDLTDDLGRRVAYDDLSERGWEIQPAPGDSDDLLDPREKLAAGRRLASADDVALQQLWAPLSDHQRRELACILVARIEPTGDDRLILDHARGEAHLEPWELERQRERLDEAIGDARAREQRSQPAVRGRMRWGEVRRGADSPQRQSERWHARAQAAGLGVIQTLLITEHGAALCHVSRRLVTTQHSWQAHNALEDAIDFDLEQQVEPWLVEDVVAAARTDELRDQLARTIEYMLRSGRQIR